MNKIQAKEGYYLTDTNKSFFVTSVYGANVSEDNYEQILIGEANNIIAERETMDSIQTLDDIDSIASANSLISKKINQIEMTNDEALDRKSLFPNWTPDSLEVKKGEKYLYNNELWECLQDHTTQSNWAPSIYTASLWAIVSSTSEGTKEDPIEYKHLMIIKRDKYYTQYGQLYIGIMDAPNGYLADLSQLPTLVKLVTE